MKEKKNIERHLGLKGDKNKAVVFAQKMLFNLRCKVHPNEVSWHKFDDKKKKVLFIVFS